jgi:hypothetical protein
MDLIQILLPLQDNEGRAFPGVRFQEVQEELTEQFGGVTAYLRSPAEGAWEEAPGEVARDRIVIYEVMTERLDRVWWAAYRKDLAGRFKQEELVVRASEVERL